MTTSVLTNETKAAFRILESIPIGLHDSVGGQRSQHTNLMGCLMEGLLSVGEIVQVPMKNGTLRSVGLIAITVPPEWARIHGVSIFPPNISAEQAKGFDHMALSVRIPPQDADQVQVEPENPS